MATSFEDDDELVLVTADDLDGMHRTIPSQGKPVPAETDSEEEKESEEEQQMKGVALDDYQPANAEEMELQRGDILVITEQTLDMKYFVAVNQRTGRQGLALAKLINYDCDDPLEPVPQQSHLRRSQVILRRGVNKDSSRRSGTLIDPSTLPPLLSSASALKPTMVDTKDRSATLSVPRHRQPDGFDDPREKRFVVSESFASRNVPVEFKRIEQFNIVSVASADRFSRPVIAFSSCRLPPSYQISHDRLLEYLKFRLDQYVESDYVVVYFHYGLSSANKPSYSWLWQMHKELDRKYKKNIKKLYIVHPTSFIKVVSALLKPYISYKFGKKLVFVNRLEELESVLYLDQVDIPTEVRKYDKTLRVRPRLLQDDNRSSFYMPLDEEQPVSIVSTFQFGVTLEELQQRSGDDIPLVMRKTIDYILDCGMSTVGIFRRTPSQYTLQEIKKKFNLGEDVSFDEYADPHLAAVTLKLFLRELPEPLLTFASYDKICSIKTLPEDQRFARCFEVIQDLPELNYNVLKFLFNFIRKVASNEGENKMSPANLSIVFGPNLLWSRNQVATLNSMSDINRFSLVLVDRYEELLTK